MNDSADRAAGTLTFSLEVSNKMGIHARPVAMIVRIKFAVRRRDLDHQGRGTSQRQVSWVS